MKNTEPAALEHTNVAMFLKKKNEDHPNVAMYWTVKAVLKTRCGCEMR